MHLSQNNTSSGGGLSSPPKTPPKGYHGRVAGKLSQQASSIPPEWRLSSIPPSDTHPDARAFIRTSGLLDDDELAITDTTDMTVLLRKLATGELSSVKVVRAFCKRAAVAHQLTRCCTEIFFQEALAEAERLDDVLRRTGQTVGPLHGLPVSVKDSVDVKGHDTSVGEFYQRLLYMCYVMVSKRRADMLCRMGWIDGQAGDARRRFGHYASQTRRRPLCKDKHSPIPHGEPHPHPETPLLKA